MSSNYTVCNIQISRTNFCDVKSTKKMLFLTKTITLTKIDFLQHPPKDANKEILSRKSETSHCYEFRKRKCTQNITLPPAKKTCSTIVRANRLITPKLIPIEKDKLKVGMIVIAKMKTYSAWPAVITSFEKTGVKVQFFGDDTTGKITYNNIGTFHDNEMLIKLNLKKKINGYIKAVRCAEGVLNIPPHLSILNA